MNGCSRQPTKNTVSQQKEAAYNDHQKRKFLQAQPRASSRRPHASRHPKPL